MYVLFDFWAIGRLVKTGDRVFTDTILQKSNTQTLLWFLTATRVDRFEGTDWAEQDLIKIRRRRRAIERELEKRGFNRTLRLSVPDVESPNPDPRFREKVEAEF